MAERGSCGDTARPLLRRLDLELSAAGWQRRHSADAERAAEAIELYRALGFEVLSRAPAAADFAPGCAACADLACRTQIVIYTRVRRVADDGPAHGDGGVQP